MLRTLATAAVLSTLLSLGTAAQDAAAVIGNASTALGAAVTAITYSGSAATGNFGQSKNINGPLALTTITSYTRTIDFAQSVSRATGETMPPTIPGGAPPQAGTLNQSITPANAAWTHQLEIWITPWGFLKGASANNATVRSQRIGGKAYSVVSWTTPWKSPSGEAYRLNGYVTDQNLIERVETWVEHPVLGDLQVEALYTDYRDFNGAKVPTRIVQKRAGLQTFEATVKNAAANPANLAQLLQPAAAPAAAPGAAQGAPAAGGRGGAAAPPPAVQAEKLSDGVYRITGGYSALAIEFKDHVVVLEGGQSDARGQAVIAETKRTIPNKPIRYVVNTHAHFDHSSGLAPFAAEGITIITHQNNKDFLEKALGGRRTLVGDALAKANRKPRVEAAGERRVLRDDTRTIELHQIKSLEHSDGMLIAYLPAEKILFSADFNVPAAGQPVSPSIATLVQNVDRLKLEFDRHVLVHAPNPDRPMTRADMLALSKGSN
jgi:glyoxylase-like metal-dependent hydrolase (beta-lactamase superfamily II)